MCLGLGKSGWSFEHGNKPSAAIKCGIFFWLAEKRMTFWRLTLLQGISIVNALPTYTNLFLESYSAAQHSVYLCNLSKSNKTGNICITWHWGSFAQPFLQWKSNKYYTFRVSVCSLRYPAWNARAPYCHLWPLRFYYVYPHYLINGTVFGKQVIEYEIRVLIFSTTYVGTFIIIPTSRCFG
jgi:hypothetical protein